jgi:hypothetical protein
MVCSTILIDRISSVQAHLPDQDDLLASCGQGRALLPGLSDVPHFVESHDVQIQSDLSDGADYCLNGWAGGPWTNWMAVWRVLLSWLLLTT